MNSTKRTRGTMRRVVRTLNEAEDTSRQDKPGTTTNGIIAVPRVSLTPSVLFSSLESSNGAVLLLPFQHPQKNSRPLFHRGSLLSTFYEWDAAAPFNTVKPV